MSDREQMNNNCETIADIEAELRKESLKVRTVTRPDGYGGYEEITLEGNPYLKNLADRIGEAWKRQEQFHLDQIRDAVNMIGHERFVKEHQPVGNAAAMREALTKIRDTIMNGGFDGRSPAHFVNICDAALSAPARNCDLYDNWYDAHQAWERLPKDELGYFVADNGVHECEQAWLLAPAAELKGDKDEQK